MNNGVEFGHGAKCCFFFLPQWNGLWLLLDPGIEHQRFRSSFRKCGQQKILCWKDMGGKQLIPLDFVELNYLQIDFLYWTVQKLQHHLHSQNQALLLSFCQVSYCWIPILEVILGVFVMPATIMPCKFLFKQMHLPYFSLIERCCVPQNEAFNTK